MKLFINNYINAIFLIVQLGLLLSKAVVPDIFGWFTAFLPAMIYVAFWFVIFISVWVYSALSELYPVKDETEGNC